MPRWQAVVLTALIVIGSLAPIPLQLSSVQELLYANLIGQLTLVVLVLAWVYNAVSQISQDQPAAFLRSGLRMVYGAGSDATGDLRRLVSSAKQSVKLLDTHWGPFDSLQSSLGEAMLRNHQLEVQLLMCQPEGVVAAARVLTTAIGGGARPERAVED